MATQQTALQKRIESGKPLLIAEMSPPKTGDPAPIRALAKRYAGKIHALGVSDNRDGVCMSALAAAALIAQEGIEPILHIVTRDQNRIGLISTCLGAQALGVYNLLCTSGTHQTLGATPAARNVFDIDSVQMLQFVAQAETPSFCLGAVAAPFADPLEFQVTRLAKKINAGAKFLITQPVYDTGRFSAWWQEVTRQSLPMTAAFVAGIRILTSADEANAYAAKRPVPCIPPATLERIASKSGAAAQRAEGIAIAIETIQSLSALEGLRGFEIRCDADPDAVLEVIEKSKLGIN